MPQPKIMIPAGSPRLEEGPGCEVRRGRIVHVSAKELWHRLTYEWHDQVVRLEWDVRSLCFVVQLESPARGGDVCVDRATLMGLVSGVFGVPMAALMAEEEKAYSQERAALAQATTFQPGHIVHVEPGMVLPAPDGELVFLERQAAPPPAEDPSVKSDEGTWHDRPSMLGGW